MCTGLTDYGSTAQTIAIAKAAHYDKKMRHDIISALKAMDDSVTYTDQDFDRRQHLAAVLADAARSART